MNEPQDYALPEDTTQRRVDELREDGKVKHGCLGVQCIAKKAHPEEALRWVIRDLTIEIREGTGASDGLPGEVKKVGCSNKAKSTVSERNREEKGCQSERSRKEVYEKTALDAEKAHHAGTASLCKRPREHVRLIRTGRESKRCGGSREEEELVVR